ncbi:MAG: hypothetical protein AAFN04_10180 [Pseudomonadota bacterium]
MRSLVLVFALFVVASFSVPAWSQTWHRAESDNYIVFAQLDEQTIRDVARNMENYRQTLEKLLPTDAKRGRKLQAYLDADAKRIIWASKKQLSGFTIAGAEFSGTFSLYDAQDTPQYRAHAVQFSQASYYTETGFFRTMPPWFRIGSPATLSTSAVSEEEIYGVANAYLVGVPDLRRPLKKSVRAEDIRSVLTREGSPRRHKNYPLFYRNSREIARVLLLDASYAGRLEAYLDALTNGASLDEALAELGDLNAIAASIKALKANRNPPVQLIPFEPVSLGSIDVRPMAKDEIALVAYRFARLGGERPKITAKRLAGVAQRFQQSAEAWYEYAAAEYALVRDSLFGGTPDFRGFGFSNSQIIVTSDPYPDRVAWQAVNRALELNPDHAPAGVLKAEIQISRLLKAFDENLGPEFEAVRTLLEPLAAQPERYPLAAAVAYQSYLEQEIEPTPEALDRLGRAFVANRGVREFRYAYASALARVGQRDEAKLLLLGLLSDPDYRDAAQAALNQTRVP